MKFRFKIVSVIGSLLIVPMVSGLPTYPGVINLATSRNTLTKAAPGLDTPNLFAEVTYGQKTTLVSITPTDPRVDVILSDQDFSNLSAIGITRPLITPDGWLVSDNYGKLSYKQIDQTTVTGPIVVSALSDYTDPGYIYYSNAAGRLTFLELATGNRVVLQDTPSTLSPYALLATNWSMADKMLVIADFKRAPDEDRLATSAFYAFDISSIDLKAGGTIPLTKKVELPRAAKRTSLPAMSADGQYLAYTYLPDNAQPSPKLSYTYADLSANNFLAVMNVENGQTDTVQSSDGGAIIDMNWLPGSQSLWYLERLTDGTHYSFQSYTYDLVTKQRTTGKLIAKGQALKVLVLPEIRCGANTYFSLADGLYVTSDDLLDPVHQLSQGQWNIMGCAAMASWQANKAVPLSTLIMP